MRYATRFFRFGALTTLLGYLAQPVAAQTWSRTYSDTSASQEWPTSITQTTDGGFIASGTSTAGAWVMKLDPVGDIQWSRVIGGWPIWPRAIETVDGGFALGSVIDILGSDGCYDNRFDLAKFDQTGVLEWHKQYGPDTVMVGGSCIGEGAQQRSIIEAPDGSFLMSGWITGAAPDLWLVKADSTGKIVWQKRYLSPGFERQDGGGDKIGLLPSGGIVLVGQGPSYSVGFDDVWVLWLDENGEIVNQRAYGGTGEDWPVDLYVTDEGDVSISVFSQSWGNFYNPWLLRLDSSGAIDSQRVYSLWNQFTTGYPLIEKLPDGNMALVAQTNGYGSGLAEISVDGTPLWTKYGYPDTQAAWSVTGIAGGGFLIASLPHHPSISDFFTLTRTDAVGGIDVSCPISDASGSFTDTTATITPSDATAVTTTYPTVDMQPLFSVPAWEITELCIAFAPQIYVNPSPVDFGSIPVGVEASETVTLSNTGTANLLISSMSVGAPFVLTSTCAGFNLIPGASCDATIEVTPSATGAIAASLSIGSDDPVTHLLEVPVLASAFDASHVFSDDFESGGTTAWGGVEP